MKPLAASLILALVVATASGTPDKPNIVYIMADDLGWAELGSYGQKKIKTPHLDRLAAEGIRFTQHYTSSPVCASARYSLMTGKHGGHSFVRSNYEIGEWDSHQGQLPMPADEITIAEILKERGYATGAFGKWGVGGTWSEGDPLKQGFDRFYGYNCQRHAHNLFPEYLVDQDRRVPLEGNHAGVYGQTYGPQKIADAALAFVDEHRDEPFFLYYPTVIPHLALQVPYDELGPYINSWEETPYTGKSYQPHPTPRAAYAAMISFMDKQMGRLLAKLEEHGLAENTVVFFTSDNGTTMLKDQVDYEFFESVAHLRGLKGEVYEGGIRVPLLVRWPGKIEPGRVSDHVGAHYDALATLADIAGIETEAPHDGISFLPELLGKEQPQHDYLFWDFAGYGGQVALRQGDWKAVLPSLKKYPEAKVELYDLAEDPSESKDLSGDHPAKVEEFTKTMIEARDEPEIEPFRFWKYE
ncbi:MAG: arylsulfatase [Verrucomicrobiales bacterium]